MSERESHKKYPLSDVEKTLFVRSTLLSGLLLAAISFVLLIIFVGLQTGDWVYATIGFGWYSYVASQMFLSSWWFVWPFAMLLVLFLFNEVFSRIIPSFQKSAMKQRQGLTGELIRMPLPAIVLCIPFTNFFEEILFRGVIISFVMLLPFEQPFVGILALAVSSAFFWLAHIQYRDAPTTIASMLLAVVLGIAYLVSGSLLVCLIAHISYNFSVLAWEHRLMLRDPDYFGGKVPNSVLSEMQAASSPRG